MAFTNWSPQSLTEVVRLTMPLDCKENAPQFKWGHCIVGRAARSLTSMVSSSRESAAALAMFPMSSGDHSVAEEQTAVARTRRTIEETAVEEFMVGAARMGADQS